MEGDVINHPSHYVENGSMLEPVDISEWFDFNRGNALKYVCRYRSKHKGNEVMDLRKASWYLSRYNMSKPIFDSVFNDGGSRDRVLLPLVFAFLRSSKNKIFRVAWAEIVRERGQCYTLDRFFEILHNVINDEIETLEVSREGEN